MLNLDPSFFRLHFLGTRRRRTDVLFIENAILEPLKEATGVLQLSLKPRCSLPWVARSW